MEGNVVAVPASATCFFAISLIALGPFPWGEVTENGNNEFSAASQSLRPHACTTLHFFKADIGCLQLTSELAPPSIWDLVQFSCQVATSYTAVQSFL